MRRCLDMYCSLRITMVRGSLDEGYAPCFKGCTYCSFLHRYKCAVSGMITIRQGLLASSQSCNCSAAGLKVKSRQTVVPLSWGFPAFGRNTYYILPKARTCSGGYPCRNISEYIVLWKQQQKTVLHFGTVFFTQAYPKSILIFYLWHLSL